MNHLWADILGRVLCLVATAGTVMAIAVGVVAYSISIDGLRRYRGVWATAKTIVTFTVAATAFLGMLVMLVCIGSDVDPPRRVTYSTVWTAWLFGIMLWTLPGV